MPIYSTHVPKNKLILSVWQKTITLPDWLSYTDKLTSSPEYQQSNLLLVDVQAAKLDFSLDDMRAVLPRYRSEKGYPARIAVAGVYARERVRQFEEICQAAGLNVVVFNSLPLASTWLGLNLLETNQAIRRLLRKA